MLDVTDLAPPGNVTHESRDVDVKIYWQASPHQNRSDFGGYNVYSSPRSLIFVAVKDLPFPIVLSKDQHEWSIPEIVGTSEKREHA